MPVNEMQHAMMSPAKAILFQDGVGAAGEVTIGKEEQLRTGDELLVVLVILGRFTHAMCWRAGLGGSRTTSTGYAVGVYVSHVDLFRPDCYAWQVILRKPMSMFARAAKPVALGTGMVAGRSWRRARGFTSQQLAGQILGAKLHGEDAWLS